MIKNETLLKLEHISFQYPKAQTEILTDVSLSVNRGEIIALTGASGCGKTTLCHVLSGLIPKRLGGEFSGEVWLKGRDTADMAYSDIAGQIGIVRQDADSQILFSRSDCEIAFAMENFCFPQETMRKTVFDTAEALAITHLLGRNPNRISGGEKQLLVFASVMVMEPNILILDEAFAEVDAQGKQRVAASLVKLKENGKAMMMVTHDRDALAICDRTLEIKNGRLKEIPHGN